MKKIDSFSAIKERKTELEIEMVDSKNSISSIFKELDPKRLIKENTKGKSSMSILKNVSSSLPFALIVLPKLISFLPIKTRWKAILKGIPITYNFILPLLTGKKKI